MLNIKQFSLEFNKLIKLSQKIKLIIEKKSNNDRIILHFKLFQRLLSEKNLLDSKNTELIIGNIDNLTKLILPFKFKNDAEKLVNNIILFLEKIDLAALIKVKKIEILKKYGFDYERYKDLGNILINNWDETEVIINILEEESIIFFQEHITLANNFIINQKDSLKVICYNLKFLKKDILLFQGGWKYLNNYSYDEDVCIHLFSLHKIISSCKDDELLFNQFIIPQFFSLLKSRNDDILIELCYIFKSNECQKICNALIALEKLIEINPSGKTELLKVIQHSRHKIDCLDIYVELMHSFLIEHYKKTLDDYNYIISKFPKHYGTVIRFGLPVVIGFINENSKNYDDFISILSYFTVILEFSDSLSGIEKNQKLFTKFGINIIEDLMIPTAKIQKNATPVYYNIFSEIQDLITSDLDIQMLLEIMHLYKYSALSIFKNIIYEGLKLQEISILSDEKEILYLYLSKFKIYNFHYYKKYKQILKSNLTDIKKGEKVDEVLGKCATLIPCIYDGDYSKYKIIDSNLGNHIGITTLYSQFPPNRTFSLEEYNYMLETCDDRQDDISKELLNKMHILNLKLSKGSFISPNYLELRGWNDIRNARDKIEIEKLCPDCSNLGFEILRSILDDTINNQKVDILNKLYYYGKHFSQNKESLPTFTTDYEILIIYNEYIKSKLKWILHEILEISFNMNQELFINLQNSIMSKEKKFVGLSKTIFHILHSKLLDYEKVSKLRDILRKNGFRNNFETQLIKCFELAEIKHTLENEYSLNSSLIDKINYFLIDGDVDKNLRELKKFKFNKERRGLFSISKKYRFVLSKKKLHCVAMMNMGVCIGKDINLWNDPNFFQMIIFDEDNKALGGAIFRILLEENFRYLVLAINPSGEILNEISIEQLYNKIITYSKQIAKILKVKNLLIPKNKLIHSERCSIKEIIENKKYTLKKLKIEHQFSFLPKYECQEFFLIQ